MIKKIFSTLFVFSALILSAALATSTAYAAIQTPANPESTFLQPASQNKTFLESVINVDDTVAVKRSTILDASQSYLPATEKNYTFEWDFGDGNRNEGVEVLHMYKNPGSYTVTLKIYNDNEESVVKKDVFVYNKLILLLTDSSENIPLIDTIKSYAEKQGVFIKIIDSFGASTEFISEEIFTKKLLEATSDIQKSLQIVAWTKENAGLNAFSRVIQESKLKEPLNLTSKSIIVVTGDIESYTNRIKRQFDLINPKNIIIVTEAGIYPLIDSSTSEDFISTLSSKGYKYENITESSLNLMPWNFLSYFLSVMIENGIPDNTIALLLIVPIIATVVTFMKQVVGVTTMGIYTPTLITLSFLIIGLYFGLLTLIVVLVVGGLIRYLLRKVHILYIPKMAIVLTCLAITLLFILILSLYFGIFNATFFSLAIFPMIILSTLVEKFISIKTERGLLSAVILTGETIIVSIIAYFIAGGEIGLGFATIKWEFVRNMMLNYPELIFLFIVINILLGRWSGLRLLEFIRFREVSRHVEEE